MRIGMVAAMKCELEGIEALLTDVRQESHSQFVYSIGRLHNCEVITVISGIGLVNAALATQLMISLYDVDCVLNPGVAGGLSSELDVCDVVVSHSAAYWDFDTLQLMTGFPYLKQMCFHADETLGTMCMERCAGTVAPNRLILGRVVSGQRFVDDLETKERLRSVFLADCVEMEGAAVAHACALTNTPFLILRSISDTLNDLGEGSLLTFHAFLEKATAQLTIALDALILAC